MVKKRKLTLLLFASVSREMCISTKVDDLEKILIKLLKEVTPRKQSTDLFLNFMYESYHKRLSRLQKIRNNANDEIDRLKAMRKVLVEKNMSGIYSDEVFKEQNSIIEEKMIQAHIVKDDTMMDK